MDIYLKHQTSVKDDCGGTHNMLISKVRFDSFRNWIELDQTVQNVECFVGAYCLSRDDD